MCLEGDCVALSEDIVVGATSFRLARVVVSPTVSLSSRLDPTTAVTAVTAVAREAAGAAKVKSVEEKPAASIASISSMTVVDADATGITIGLSRGEAGARMTSLDDDDDSDDADDDAVAALLDGACEAALGS